jgi:hypothetical protein
VAQLTAVRTNADISTDELLGFLEFHTIGDLRIHKDQLGDIFDSNGLDNKFLPREIKPHDAYRRATAKAQSTIEINGSGDKKQKARLLVREVKADDNMVVRHLVREIVDSQNEVLDYNTVGKFIFKRKSGTMDVSWSPDYLDEYEYDVLIEDIRSLFVDWTEYHTRDTVNNMVRRIINDMNHISVMPNGKATFIPRNQRHTLECVKGMIEDLEEYHNGEAESIIEIIPVIDTVDQREMVKKRAETQLSGEANQLLADFAELLGQDTTSVKTVQRYAKRVTELQDRLGEYEDLIHRKMDVLGNQLQDALTKIKRAEAAL